MCDAVYYPLFSSIPVGTAAALSPYYRPGYQDSVMWTLGSACSPTRPAVASLNLGFPISPFPLLFYRLQKACREASPTLEHKYLPVKKTFSHQSKPRQVGTQTLQMSGEASISGGARWPSASPGPQTLQPPSLPTSLAEEETEVRMVTCPSSHSIQRLFHLFILFFLKVCLNT